LKKEILSDDFKKWKIFRTGKFSTSHHCSELRRTLTGLLFNPQVIYEYEELRWNDSDRGEVVSVVKLRHWDNKSHNELQMLTNKPR
jgi:hypothetical protein